MLSSLILMAAMTGQAPPPRPVPAATATVGQREAAQLVAKRRARKAAQARSDAAAAERARRRTEAEYREWKALLPYQMEQQRQALENQRQMLERQSDIERNRALNRLAGAAERSAGYIYPGQSPTVGPYR